MSLNRTPTLEMSELDLHRAIPLNFHDSKELNQSESSLESIELKEIKLEDSSSRILEKIVTKPIQKSVQSSPKDLLEAAIEIKRLEISKKILKLFPASRIYDRWELYLLKTTYEEFQSARLETEFHNAPNNLDFQDLKQKLFDYNNLIKKMGNLMQKEQIKTDVKAEEPEETPERFFAKQLIELLQSDYFAARYRF